MFFDEWVSTLEIEIGFDGLVEGDFKNGGLRNQGFAREEFLR